MRSKLILSIGIFALVASLAPAPVRAADTILHNFTGGVADGDAPQGSLILSGSTIYGMTSSGGVGGSTGNGTLFSMNTNGTGFSLLHSFTGTAGDGRAPHGSLTLSGSTLYGMTTFGGDSSGGGTIFSLNTNGTGYSVLHSFDYFDDGGHPYGALTLSGSKLYGTTSESGIGGGTGTLFSMNTNGTGYTVLHSFTGGASDGRAPYVTLTLSGSTLYGTTFAGGSGDSGTIFKMNTDGTGFSLLHSFVGGAVDGDEPAGALTLVGSKLYGVTNDGGSKGAGTVFSVNTDGTGFSLLHSFDYSGSGGYWPSGALTLVGSRLYGTTDQSGSSSGIAGALYSLNLDGSDYQLLQNFPSAPFDGQLPNGGLILSGDASTLYGMTSNGGTAGKGVVFSVGAVPEPASAALFGFGSLALFAGRRRRIARI